MIKNECETAIRQLCHEWAKGKGFLILPDFDPGFGNFKNWLVENHYSHYLNFKSVAGPDYDAEVWFDQELKQMWRR